MLKNIKCSLCKNQKSCAILGMGDAAIEGCGMFNLIDQTPVRTNGDRIRHMTDEDLAEFLAFLEDKTAEPGEFKQTIYAWLNWLKQEAKE